MRCPYCGAEDLRVLDTRDSEQGVRRRRECAACERRFTTYERIAPTVLVTKRDGRREEFDAEKVLEGLRRACAKRPVSTEVLERLVQKVQDSIISSGRAEVSSRTIGDLVMAELREIDDIAYVRFASVYVPLGDLESIRSEIDRMMDQRRKKEA
ncbi:MAG: transcriptional regulator NrdR [Anaerolineae bacterium]